MRFIFLWFTTCVLPSWRQKILHNQGDRTGFDSRVLSDRHLRKRSVVKNFWIIAGLLMLLQPVLHVVLVVGMFTTFLSFMYLDEC